MTGWEAKETRCEVSINQMLPCCFSIYSFSFHLCPPLSDTYTWGLERLGSVLGLGLELRLRLIKFPRHHWQACCSSSRAINLVLPITVLLPLLLLLPFFPSPLMPSITLPGVKRDMWETWQEEEEEEEEATVGGFSLLSSMANVR